MLPWATPESITQTASPPRSVQPFYTAHGSVLGHARACPFPIIIAPSHGGSGPPYNTCFLRPHSSPQPKRHLDRFSRFCTAYNRVSSGVGVCSSPQNCPFSWGSGPHLIRGSLSPPDSASQIASRSAQPFCTAHGRQSSYLTMGAHFP